MHIENKQFRTEWRTIKGTQFSANYSDAANASSRNINYSCTHIIDNVYEVSLDRVECNASRYLKCTSLQHKMLGMKRNVLCPNLMTLAVFVKNVSWREYSTSRKLNDLTEWFLSWFFWFYFFVWKRPFSKLWVDLVKETHIANGLLLFEFNFSLILCIIVNVYVLEYTGSRHQTGTRAMRYETVDKWWWRRRQRWRRRVR